MIAYGCASACDVRVCEYVKVYVRVFREQERERDRMTLIWRLNKSGNTFQILTDELFGTK